MDFDSFHYSPFSIQEDSDDDTPLTQRHLKDLYAKLDSLLASSTTSSTEAYSKVAIKSMLDTLVKEHAMNFILENKAVESSILSIQQAIEKGDKLISDTKIFILEVNTAAKANVVKENEAISKLSTSLRIEREKLEQLRSGISTDNTTFHSSIS